MSRCRPHLATLDDRFYVAAPPRPTAGAHVRRAGGGRRRRAGLTLPELLTCLGILVLFAAIVLPAIFRLRQSARDVICQSRLRSLAIGVEGFRARHRAYPGTRVAAAPMPDVEPPGVPPPADPAGPDLTTPVPPAPPIVARVAAAEPQQVDVGLLNQLARFVGYQRVAPGTATVDLPSDVQSPDVEATAEARGGAGPTYYTGFVYVPAALGLPAAGGGGAGTLLRTPGPARPVLLRPNRVPGTSAADGRHVLWADDVHASGLGTKAEAWRFAHPRPGAEPLPDSPAFRSGGGCRGQHLVYADGSVEWVPGPALGLDGIKPADADRSATVRWDGKYWWF